MKEVPDCECGKHLLLRSGNSQTFQTTCKQTAGSSGLGDYIGINLRGSQVVGGVCEDFKTSASF